MSDKKFSLLGILAAASIVLAVAVSHYANKSRPATSGIGYLIQGLDPAAVAKITVKQDKNTVTLKRQQDGFVIVEKANYPVPTKMINNLFTSCFDIKTVEFYTEDEKNYKDLGINEEDAQGVIRFFDAGDKLITGFIVGKDIESGKGSLSYGKLVNDNKVYVLTDIPYIQATAIDYANRDLVYINKNEIASIIVSSPKDMYNLIPEANGTEVILKEPPAGKKQNNAICQQVLGALSGLRFDDVIPASQGSDFKFDYKFTCLMKDSTLINIEIAKKDSKSFMKCSADFTDKTQVRKEESVESQEELKKKESKLLAKERAKKLAETTDGWIYEISSYYADNMTKPLSELVEDDANTPQPK